MLKSRPSTAHAKVSSVSRRFNFAFIGVVALLFITFAAVGTLINLSIWNKREGARLDFAIQLAQVSLSQPLWDLDSDTIDAFIESLFFDETIVYARISRRSQVIALKIRPGFQIQEAESSMHPLLFRDSDFMVKTSDINFQDTKFGRILIVMSRESSRQQVLYQIYGIAAFVILAIAAIWVVQTRTSGLVQSVEELRALGEVSRTVSSTLDVEQVLESIVRNAVRLSRTNAGIIYEFDETKQVFIPRIHHGIGEAFITELKKSRLQTGDKSGIDKAISKKSPYQIQDLADVPGFPLAYVRPAGFQSLLVLPLFRKEKLIGVLIILRKAAGWFPTVAVELLQSFTAQSVLAFHNAHLYREIEQKGRELETASRHKSQFLANMSHELRTPLNAILGYTELILDNIYGDVPEKIQEVLERLEKNGRHLLNLINDVLDLSKIEAGQLTLSINEYSIGELVQSVCASLEALAAEKNLALTVQVPADLENGMGDEQRIAQVLLNLIGNAIKFTEEGLVKVRVNQSDDSFQVSVSDTGPGIAETEVENIFEEFHQADESTTREKGGTGLGLAISKRIVEMHGGRIWVTSALGKGSDFQFELPFRVEQQKEIS